MANNNFPPLPPLEPILASVRRTQNQKYAAPERSKLSLQEVIEQLKEHFGKDDITKLANALADNTELERTTTCPLLRSAQITCQEAVNDGEIKLIRRKNGTNNVLCSRYNLTGLGYPEYSCCMGEGDNGYKTCPFHEA